MYLLGFRVILLPCGCVTQLGRSKLRTSSVTRSSCSAPHPCAHVFLRPAHHSIRAASSLRSGRVEGAVCRGTRFPVQTAGAQPIAVARMRIVLPRHDAVGLHSREQESFSLTWPQRLQLPCMVAAPDRTSIPTAPTPVPPFGGAGVVPPLPRCNGVLASW